MAARRRSGRSGLAGRRREATARRGGDRATKAQELIERAQWRLYRLTEGARGPARAVLAGALEELRQASVLLWSEDQRTGTSDGSSSVGTSWRPPPALSSRRPS